MDVGYDDFYCVRTRVKKLPPTPLESLIFKVVTLLNPPYITHIYLHILNEAYILTLLCLTKTAIYFFDPRSNF